MPKAPARAAARVRKPAQGLPGLADRSAVLGGQSAIPSEHIEQVHVVAWFGREFPGVRIFAIPNGGKRGMREATRMKAEGVRPGVPDMYVPAWRMWIEMKRQKGGSVSPEQKDWHAYLRGIGDAVLVCKGFEDAKAQVLSIRRTVIP